MSKSLTFMGHKLADTCSSCKGDGYMVTASGTIRCPVCKGDGLDNRDGMGALLKLVREINSLEFSELLTRKYIQSAFLDFERAVGYVEPTHVLVSIKAPQRTGAETQDEYEARCREILESVTKTMQEKWRLTQ